MAAMVPTSMGSGLDVTRARLNHTIIRLTTCTAVDPGYGYNSKDYNRFPTFKPTSFEKTTSFKKATIDAGELCPGT
jgi:hypothetical protein